MVNEAVNHEAPRCAKMQRVDIGAPEVVPLEKQRLA